MKKLFLFALACAMSLTTFAQWNNTGDSKTTGSLTLGAESSSHTGLTIISKKVANEDMNSFTYPMFGTPAGKRDITFRGEDGNGTAVIRSYTGGGWGGGLMFMTGIADWKIQQRFHLHAWGYTEFHDKNIYMGSRTINSIKEEGGRLIFDGTAEANGIYYLTKYAHDEAKGDIRLVLGWNAENRFVVGTGEGEHFKPNFYVMGNGNVGIGLSECKNSAYKLEVNGTIRAKEVRVESGWADFVFQKDYQLPTLQEVKAHIDEYKHLPGMPSEAEVKENGVGLADATTRLLQKVEELTLYAIQQQEKIEALSNQINELKNEKK